MKSSRVWLLAAVALAGCEAQIIAPAGWRGEGGGSSSIGGTGGGSGTGAGAVEPVNPCTAAVSVGSAPMRRLSHEEYRNSLGDLQPSWATVVAQESARFPSDTESLGFRNGAVFLDVQPPLAQAYFDAAEKVAAQAVTNLTALLPCSPTGNEAGCAEQFIRSFGRRLYRRALSADEVTAYQTVYGNARTGGYDFKTGIEWVVFTFLNAPGFLYRAEIDPAGATGVRSLSGLELASRLSYLLWQSAPDEALLAAAEGGQLTTRPELEAQARRMVDDPKARRLVGFFDQWLKWESLDGMQRSTTAFPSLPSGLGGLLHQETRLFAEKTVFDGDGTLGALLKGEYTYVDPTLARHYGLPVPTGSGFARVSTPGRGGLLTLGGTLAARDLANRTSIVHRGVAIRTAIMCQVIPAPPNNVPALGPIDASLTQAQRLAEHRTNPSCGGCHNLIDPLGTPFEGFDAVGRARTVDEAGNPIDSSGALSLSRDEALNGPVSNAAQLVGKLGESGEVRDCFTTQLYRFSMGRKEESADSCSVYTLQQRFELAGGNVKELLISLTQLDDFDHRQVTP